MASVAIEVPPDVPPALSSVHAEGEAAGQLLDRHASEVQAAYQDGRWRGSVDMRLAGHDREFGDLRGAIGRIEAEQKEQGESLTAVHGTLTETLAAANAVKKHIEETKTNRWTLRQFIVTVSMALCGAGGSIAAIISILH